MDVVTIIVFFAVWLVCGGVAGFMVYVTPYSHSGHIIAAVLASWAIAMIVAGLIHIKRNPFKKNTDEQTDEITKT